jgi:Ankyrin repeats (3 copies)/Ankyrin repeats (many copies)
LAELPDTLDETYERTLRDISKADAELARRLFQCVAVASRPLCIEELAEFLAFDFKEGQIPEFREDWRLEDPVEAVLSTCSTLLSLINVDDSTIIQFSHFSVKEFLTSSRFAEKHDIISCRYHISMTAAHIVVAQACLGILLYLDENVTRDSLDKFPLVKYAAEHWFEHARSEGVSGSVEEGMRKLFDPRTPYLAIWLWIHDPIMIYQRPERPSPPRGTPLHYASFCGLPTIVKFLVIERLQAVRSQGIDDKSTPLHLASGGGHVEVARFLVKRGARLTAQDRDRSTPLHWASKYGHVDLARFLVEHGARLTVKDRNRSTPLHWASKYGHVDLALFLIQHGANVAAKDKDGLTPLHRGRTMIVWISPSYRRTMEM